MTHRHQDQIVRFLTEHQAGLVTLTEQAYGEVGGHYALLTPDERRRQAEIDSGELSAVLIRAALTQEEVQQTLRSITSFAVLSDVVRMAEAQERMLTPFVQTRLADQPEVASEILARMRNLSVRFRRNLAVAHMHNVAHSEDSPAPSDIQD